MKTFLNCFIFLIIGIGGTYSQCPGFLMNYNPLPFYSVPNHDTIDNPVDSICEYYTYMCDTSKNEQIYYTWFSYPDTFPNNTLISLSFDNNSTPTPNTNWASLVFVNSCNQ